MRELIILILPSNQILTEDYDVDYMFILTININFVLKTSHYSMKPQRFHKDRYSFYTQGQDDVVLGFPC